MKELRFPAKLRKGSSNDIRQRVITVPKKNLDLILYRNNLSLDEITDAVFVLRVEKIILLDGRIIEFNDT